MKKKSIALAMIVREWNGEQGDRLVKCVQSVPDFVDEIYLTNTGEVEMLGIFPAGLSQKIHLSHFNQTTHPEAFFGDGVIKRFDLARAFNFSQVKEDWILWLDHDDTLKHPEKLQELAQKGEVAGISGWAFNYKYLWDQKTGEVQRQHWKTQFVKNDGSLEWVGWVHEDLLPKGGDPNILKSSECVRVHWRTVEEYPASQGRNLRILKAKLEDEGDKPDPRTLFYYGSELTTIPSLVEEGIEALKIYLELSGWDEERWQAYQYIAGVRQSQGKFEEAIRWYLLSLKERPDYPDPYFGLGLCYQKLNRHERALYWIEQGLTKKMPDTNIPLNPQMYTWRPLSIGAYSCLMLGKFDKAKQLIGAARKFAPRNSYLKELETTVLEARRQWRVSEAFLTIARFLKDKDQKVYIQNLISSVPIELRDDPIITRIRNEATPPKTWGPKSIVYFAHGMTEPWSPKNLEHGGIGGSEEAIIYLTREFAQRGYEVTVYNWCDNDGGVYDGVTYKNYWEFNPWDKFNILIGWRMPGFLDATWNAKQVYLDLHDVCSPFDFPPRRQNNVHKIFVKSKYHRSLFPDVPDEKFVIVGNGIDLEDFKPKKNTKVVRNPKQVLYTSAPNRGLDILLNLWPLVLKEVPDAKLKCFYGWKSYEAIEKNNKQSMRFMARMKAQMEELGIDYPRISQKEMAKEIAEAGLWAYPTYFPEIDCITAKKMQAGGAIPVIANYAALKENVLFGERIEGDIYRKDVKEEWLKAIISLLKEPNRQGQIREVMQKDARERFSWENVGDVWINQFNLPLVEK